MMSKHYLYHINESSHLFMCKICEWNIDEHFIYSDDKILFHVKLHFPWTCQSGPCQVDEITIKNSFWNTAIYAISIYSLSTFLKWNASNSNVVSILHDKIDRCGGTEILISISWVTEPEEFHRVTNVAFLEELYSSEKSLRSKCARNQNNCSKVALSGMEI